MRRAPRLMWALLWGMALAGASAKNGGEFTAKELQSLYYADLGPPAIDVSGYPQDQKARYRLFSRVCSRCHTLARAVNAPMTSRTAWELYVFGMRLRGRLGGGAGFSGDEGRRIVDFLVYDSKARKIDRAAQFEELTLKLQKRFAATIDERMRRLQRATPHPIPMPPPGR